MNNDEDDLEAAPATLRAGSWPRRRLTVELVGLLLLGGLIALVVVVVFVLVRNTTDPEQAASGIEGLLSLGAVLVGAIAGWMGRSALGDAPVRATRDTTPNRNGA